MKKYSLNIIVIVLLIVVSSSCKQEEGAKKTTKATLGVNNNKSPFNGNPSGKKSGNTNTNSSPEAGSSKVLLPDGVMSESTEEKLAAEKKSAEKDLADKVADKKAVQAKLAADKVAAEAKIAADKAVAEAKLAVEKATSQPSSNKLSQDGLNLVFILNHKCIKERSNKRAAGELVPRYFVDREIDIKKIDAALELFPDTAVKIQIPSTMAKSDLERVADADPCIVGITDDVRVATSTSNVASTAPAKDHRAFLEADSSVDEFFKSSISNKVKVAVIDTGVDYTNTNFNQGVLSKSEGLFVRGDYLSKYAMATAELPIDNNGHGTEMISLIAGNGTSGVKGLAPDHVHIFPIKIEGIENGIDKIGAIMLFNAIKRAVNFGAEVINLSLSGIVHFNKDESQEKKDQMKSLMCHPLVGHALFRAVERGTLVVVSGGNIGKEVWNPVKNTYEYVPAEVEENLDFKSWKVERAVYPACWARYFKGVISVAALDTKTKTIGPVSNWGAKSMEIAAPGTDIAVSSLKGKSVIKSGTSTSAAIVTAAAALTISHYKTKGWAYSPWSIEDVILNSAKKDVLLGGTTKGVVNNRTLNMKSLVSYLEKLGGLTEQQRERLPSENPEDGLEVKMDIGQVAVAIPSLDKIRIITKQFIASSLPASKIQFQTIADFSDGSQKVITSLASYTVSDPTALEVISGIGYPKRNASGILTVTANYKGKTSSTTFSLQDSDVIYTGRGSDAIVKLEVLIANIFTKKVYTVAELQDLDVVGNSLEFYNLAPKVLAHYSSGKVRDVSQEASFHSNTKSITVYSFGILFQTILFGGDEITLGALYEGSMAKTSLKVKKWDLKTTKYLWQIPYYEKTSKDEQDSVFVADESSFRKSPWDGAFSEPDKQQLLHVIGAELVAEGELPKGALLSTGKNTNGQADLHSVLDGLFKRSMFQIGKKHRAYVYVDFRGKGTSQKMTLMSNWLLYTDVTPRLVKFERTFSVCPVGVSRLPRVLLEYDNGEAVGVNAKVNLSGTSLSNRSGVLDEGENSRENYGAIILLDNQDIGKDIIINASLTSNPELVAKIPCKVTSLSESISSDKNFEGFTLPAISTLSIPTPKVASTQCKGGVNKIENSGLENNPHSICTAKGLQEILNYCNLNPTSQCSVRLENNLDFSSFNFSEITLPIGSVPQSISSRIDIDGAGYKISNINIIDQEADFKLFSVRSLKNLGLDKITVASRNFNLVTAFKIENVWLNEAILRTGYTNVFASYGTIEKISVSNVKVSTNSDVVFVSSLQAVDHSRFENIEMTCVLKYGCSSGTIANNLKKFRSNYILNLVSNGFLHSGVAKGANHFLFNRIENIQIKARNVSGMTDGSHGGDALGLGYISTQAAFAQANVNAHLHIASDFSVVFWGNYFKGILEGETDASIVGDFSRGAALVANNHVYGDLKITSGGNCAGIITSRGRTSGLRLKNNDFSAVRVLGVDESVSRGGVVGCRQIEKYNSGSIVPQDEEIAPSNKFPDNLPLIGKQL
jgi:hypothetical protein